MQLKKSQIIQDPGYYHFEFLKEKIAIVKWEEPPPSTLNWVFLENVPCYLKGTSENDLCAIQVKIVDVSTGNE